MSLEIKGANDPAVLELDLTAYPRISKGNDSNVYRNEEYVFKEYHNLNMDQVVIYTALQNRASEYLKNNPYRTKIKIDDQICDVFATKVVPIQEIYVLPSGVPVARSDFIEATNLEKLMWRPEWFQKYAKAELTDKRLMDFSYEMNRLFWEGFPTRPMDEFVYHTCMLSRLLDKILSVSGLYISKYNIKLQPAEGSYTIELVITDLALYIDRVDYSGK